MAKTLLRFLLLFALLLLGYASAHAQSTTDTATAAVTDFSGLEPEASTPTDPRYAPAAELSELKTQMQTLLQAYDQLVTRYNAQNTQLQLLQQQATAAPGRPRAHRAAATAAGSN